MSSTPKLKLPPNPYKRSPVKRREDLAGREREQKAIRYYLNLTAAGQSPHLALIGQRGVGKTSLLNGAESIARELKLLPVRLDMNEQKANSQWIFWRDLYQTLALAMAKAGCWGGVQGKIYADLLRMIHARQVGSLDSAVMQIPYVFSCHQGDAETFECPDALVVNDFESCMIELQSKGFSGIALLIDEADCLGQNVPLLQMFRNIFQTVEHCSLILAGTEAVFPALSEVFSPIPRQFHRIDIKPFTRWSETMELVIHPIPMEIFEKVAPEPEVIQELHELCGGAPDEVQLYCHHMYRSIEDNPTSRMSLSPQVFRSVLREYRSNSSANVDAVLTAIERLPDKLLFESKWLSRRSLTLDENIRVSILARELKNGKALSPEERDQVRIELTEGYKVLFDAGISEVNNCLRLAGAPLTAGFWKSFVKVEREKSWTWDDDSFAENLRYFIAMAVGRDCKAVGEVNISDNEEAINALLTLREGKVPAEFDDGMDEMIVTALFARDEKSTHVVDVALNITSPAGKHTFYCRFLEQTGHELRRDMFQAWLEQHQTLLAGNEVTIVMSNFRRWQLPDSLELHRLGRISGHRIPKVFGPTQNEQAVQKFGEGDMQGCIELLEKILSDKDDAYVRNNLAFCQILKGDISDAIKNTEQALQQAYEPIIALNKAVAEFLSGNSSPAKELLFSTLDKLREPKSEFDNSASFVLVVEATEEKVGAHAGITVDAAILINLFRMGFLPKTELEAELNKYYPNAAKGLLEKFAG